MVTQLILLSELRRHYPHGPRAKMIDEKEKELRTDISDEEWAAAQEAATKTDLEHAAAVLSKHLSKV